MTLDLFRSGLICPEGVSRFAWDAEGERLSKGQELEGDQGELFVRGELDWVTLLWRNDSENTSALVAIGLRPASHSCRGRREVRE